MGPGVGLLAIRRRIRRVGAARTDRSQRRLLLDARPLACGDRPSLSRAAASPPLPADAPRSRSGLPSNAALRAAPSALFARSVRRLRHPRDEAAGSSRGAPARAAPLRRDRAPQRAELPRTGGAPRCSALSRAVDRARPAARSAASLARSAPAERTTSAALGSRSSAFAIAGLAPAAHADSAADSAARAGVAAAAGGASCSAAESPAGACAEGVRFPRPRAFDPCAEREAGLPPRPATQNRSDSGVRRQASGSRSSEVTRTRRAGYRTGR